jgi:hypothetical protein
VSGLDIVIDLALREYVKVGYCDMLGDVRMF